MNRFIFAMVIALIPLALSSCFKKTPVNENALLHQRACIESISQNDFLRANTHCELCLEYDAAMPECLNGIGLIALSNKDEEKAKTFFTRALRQNNDYSQARNNLGVIYFMRGEFELALRYFDRALEIDPSNTDARYNCGLANFRIGQKMRANSNKEASIKHLLSAKDQLNKLVAIEPTYPSAFRDLGLIHLNLYDQEEFEQPRNELLAIAKQSFARCKEVDAEEDGCYEGLAQVNFQEGRFDQSFTNYFLCLTYSPTNSACREGIVTAYEKSAQADGGYQKYARSIGQQPDNALAHEAFCNALFERGLDKEAVKECEVALRLKPDLCNAQYRLAEYFASVLDAGRATKYCQAYLACGNKVASPKIGKCQEILATVRRQ